MKKLFLVLILSAAQIVPLTLATQEPQEIEQITSEQEQIIAILIGLNRWCNQISSQLPQQQIEAMIDTIKELAEAKEFKALLSVYKQCVDSFDKEEESLTLVADEIFLPANQLESLIQKYVKRGLCSRNGVFSAQTRDLFLGCYLPFGLENAVITIPQTVEQQ
jgi:vacuolar-type H+-ATPase subunit E/Vma4